MDAKDLFEQGVAAIRERRDMAEGRRLLSESLKLDASNDMAWLWLSRTLDDPARQLQCVERALSLNPANEKAREIQRRLRRQAAEPAAPTAAAPSHAITAPTAAQQREIAALLDKANHLAVTGDDAGALRQWLAVLQIQADHEIAMRGAVKTLVRQGQHDDARALVRRAIDAGTTHPSIYLTAMDFARKDDDHTRLESLRAALALLPEIDEPTLARVADDYLKIGQGEKAFTVLKNAVESFPQSQKLLLRLGDLSESLGRPREAMVYYNRAAGIDHRTPEGRAADKKLGQSAPVLTDRERGSLAMAWREAAAFGLFYLLLAWQDAGLNLANMGAGRWLGVALSVAGGYLLVTATSSPQQRTVARLLGGTVPDQSTPIMEVAPRGRALEEPTALPLIAPAVRASLGVAGSAVLVLAFVLVFGRALGLLLDPVTPDFSYIFGG